jgi:hypothetical protein
MSQGQYVKVIENNYARWTWVLVDQMGDTVEMSDVQFATREDALDAARLRYADDHGIGYLVDGRTYGLDAEPISLPKVNRLEEQARAGL